MVAVAAGVVGAYTWEGLTEACPSSSAGLAIMICCCCCCCCVCLASSVEAPCLALEDSRKPLGVPPAAAGAAVAGGPRADGEAATLGLGGFLRLMAEGGTSLCPACTQMGYKIMDQMKRRGRTLRLMAERRASLCSACSHKGYQRTDYMKWLGVTLRLMADAWTSLYLACTYRELERMDLMAAGGRHGGPVARPAHTGGSKGYNSQRLAVCEHTLLRPIAPARMLPLPAFRCG